MYYNDGDIMKDKIISVRIMPNGYGKASEEVRNYILNLHDEIERLNNIIRRADALLELKQMRYLNESNYRINTISLQEVRDILKEIKENNNE